MQMKRLLCVCLIIPFTIGAFTTTLPAYADAVPEYHDRVVQNRLNTEDLPIMTYGEIDATGAIMTVSEPISFEEILRSEHVHDLDEDLRQKIENALAQNISPAESFQIIDPTAYIEVGAITIQGLPPESFHYMFDIDIASDMDYSSNETVLDSMLIDDDYMITPASFFADLAVWGLTTSSSQPLAHDVPHFFQFQVGNFGNITAQNVLARVYLGQLHLITFDLEFIIPGHAYTVTFPLNISSNANIGGAQELAIVVSTTSPEVNLANNRESRLFAWAQVHRFIDLAVTQINSNNGIGNGRFTAAIFQNFYAVVYNFGNMPANNVVISLWIDNQQMFIESPLGSPMPAHSSLEVHFHPIRVPRSGNYLFYVRIDDTRLHDVNPVNNRFHRFLLAEPDGCGLSRETTLTSFQGITVRVACGRIGNLRVQQAVSAWRGITPNVTFASSASIHAGTEDANITVYSSDDFPVGVYGAIRPRQGYLRDRVNVLINETYWRDLELNRPYLDQHSAENFRMAILKHEIGHVIGLGHPCYNDYNINGHFNYGNDFCRDPAIMRRTVETFSHFVTEHDRVALIRRHG